MIRTLEVVPEVTYSMCHAAASEVPLTGWVAVRSKRHRVERVFQEAKGEAGLAHYEVRSYVGWHHHITLSLLALWFLILERQRIGGKTPAMTVCQVRAIFTALLRKRPPKSAEIAQEISEVLRRNEEARIYRWHVKIKAFPPRRSTSGFS